ncbi:MAG: hypothetical protein CVU44_15260 [Chloroflexi bacterium HGW-Chloroflexi-6]|nr:MAG: hypothetical protein CVU44_15260 [Chloroflexi bacterium HGW-Chloroflexi-6]
MNTPYHISMTGEALGPYFSPVALKQIIAANLGQDSLGYQFAHDHFHFDNNSFVAGYAYVETCRQNTILAIRAGQVALARAEFGRLTHTVQDFYAHTNYTALWRELHPGATPEQIDPLFESCMTDPRLHSGRLYYPLEILYFVPFLREWVLPRLPKDSHAQMNKDEPSCPDFEYARSAATHRTRVEWLRLAESLTDTEKTAFTGQANSRTQFPSNPEKV